MPYHAYSPDLALSDFWLFGFLKQQLESYSDEKSLKRAVTETLENMPEDMYRVAQKSFAKIQLVIVRHCVHAKA